MKVLVSGHSGYIGAVLTRELTRSGHDVAGLDIQLFHGCDLGDTPEDVPSLHLDIRDVTREQLHGYDAIIHLAALCNDPVGELNRESTYQVNHLGSYVLARLAKEAGVPRFLFSSSCSLYGASKRGVCDERS